MEREYTIETTTSSTKPVSYLFRVWKKSWSDGDTSIEASIYDMTKEDLEQLQALVVKVLCREEFVPKECVLAGIDAQALEIRCISHYLVNHK